MSEYDYGKTSITFKKSPLENRIDYGINSESGEETVFISHCCNHATLYISTHNGTINGFVCTRMGELLRFRNKYNTLKEEANQRDAKAIFKEVKKILEIEDTLEKCHCPNSTEDNKHAKGYYSGKSDLLDFLGIEDVSQIKNFFLD